MEKNQEGFQFTWEDAPPWKDINVGVVKFAADAGLIHPSVINWMDSKQLKHLCAALDRIYRGSEGDPDKVSWMGIQK